MIIGEFQPTPPYDFDLTLRIMRFGTVLDTAHEGAYWRLLRTDTGLALVQVVSIGITTAPRLQVRMVAGGGDPVSIMDKLHHILGVSADMNSFLDFTQNDTILYNIVQPLRGLRNIHTETLFEALSFSIIEQQISLAAAQKGERWLVEQYGESITYQGQQYFSFPTPERLAALSVDELKPLKITNRRIALLIDIAQQQATGHINLETLQTLLPHEAYTLLLHVKGIGHWTATWTLIRGLGHYGYVFHNDVALQAAVNFYYFGTKGRAAPQVVEDVFARYGQYAGIAAFFVITRWALERY